MVDTKENVFLFRLYDTENVQLTDDLSIEEYLQFDEISEDAKLYAIREIVFEFIEAQDVRAINAESANHFLILLRGNGKDQAISLSDLNKFGLEGFDISSSQSGYDIEEALRLFIEQCADDGNLLMATVVKENTQHWSHNFVRASGYYKGTFDACGPTEDCKIIFISYSMGELDSGDIDVEYDFTEVGEFLGVTDTDSVDSEFRVERLFDPNPNFYKQDFDAEHHLI